MASGWLEVEKRVEGRNPFHVARIHLEQLSHLAHRIRGQVSQLLLGDVQRRYDGAAQLWKARRKRLDLVDGVCRKRHQWPLQGEPGFPLRTPSLGAAPGRREKQLIRPGKAGPTRPLQGEPGFPLRTPSLGAAPGRREKQLIRPGKAGPTRNALVRFLWRSVISGPRLRGP